MKRRDKEYNAIAVVENSINASASKCEREASNIYIILDKRERGNREYAWPCKICTLPAHNSVLVHLFESERADLELKLCCTRLLLHIH